MIAKSSWTRRILDRMFWWMLRGSRVRSGPLMFEVRGQYYFLDFNGRLYRLRPHHNPEQPFAIEVLWDLW